MIWQTKSACALALGTAASQVGATNLRIGVAGLRSTNGTVHAAVCNEEGFLRRACGWFGSAPASEGTVTAVSPGTYAVQGVHDENDNLTVEGQGFLPAEGKGPSRDAIMRFGPPRWDDAQLDLTERGATIRLTLRYFQ